MLYKTKLLPKALAIHCGVGERCYVSREMQISHKKLGRLEVSALENFITSGFILGTKRIA